MFSSEGVACLSSTGIFKHSEFCAGLEHETINGITGTSPLTSTFLKAACHYHSLKIEVCELLAMGYSLSGGSTAIVLQQFLSQDLKRVTSSIKEFCIVPYYANKIL